MPRRSFLLLVVAVFMAMAWLYYRAGSSAATPETDLLGAHALVGQEDHHAASIARAPALRTAASGSSLVAFVAGYASNRDGPTDNYGNRWRRFGTPVVYRGYQDRFDVRAYLAENPRGGSGHVISVAKPGEPSGEMTLAVVEALRAGRLVDASRTYPATGWRLSSAPVRTDGPALLVAFWWGDSGALNHHVAPGDGFRVIERFTRLPPQSAVQGVVAVREVDRAGRYAVTWYNQPRQGAVLWLFAFAAEHPRRSDAGHPSPGVADALTGR